jgi:hypothetical protein
MPVVPGKRFGSEHRCERDCGERESCHTRDWAEASAWAPPGADQLQQEEVVRMPVETPTKNERRPRERLREVIEPEAEGTLRALAIEQIHRVRRFKLHVAVFALGVPLLGGLWVLTEYYEEHTWPSRFASDPDVAGTWDPWFFWLAGIWFIILAIHALRTHFGPPVGPIGRYIRRPVTPAEVDREVAHLKSRRWSGSGPARPTVR